MKLEEQLNTRHTRPILISSRVIYAYISICPILKKTRWFPHYRKLYFLAFLMRSRLRVKSCVEHSELLIISAYQVYQWRFLPDSPWISYCSEQYIDLRLPSTMLGAVSDHNKCLFNGLFWIKWGDLLPHIILQIAHLFFLPLLISSLITHGFGTPAICAALSTFQTVLSEMLNYLEKHTTHKNGGAADSGQGHGTSEKAPLRKTSEAAVKEGKTEKTD